MNSHLFGIILLFFAEKLLIAYQQQWYIGNFFLNEQELPVCKEILDT
ncbi:hypothetical protein [Chlamydia abortus]|nr:hypothetical protein [Chlamydia abortus]AUS59813.1 uncharacterized protein CHAB577_0392 [Chlamydia abortus]QRR32052.1 hypothetical protein JS522_01885 [Chlamydia abortus]